MKNQFTIFLFLIFAIPSFGQNIEGNTSQEIKRLPHAKIKSIVSDLKEYETSKARTGCCNPHYVIEGYLRVIGDCEKIAYCRGIKLYFSGTEASKYSNSTNNCSVITNTNEQAKKRYIALTERYSSRYPNGQTQKTPELQSTLQEIRF